ncbi:MAG: DUF4190 domain-containing protein [Microbacteriaceae bacterium]|nr:MAG: DUF4190 domain-containing protein [Microbacteriaceae bacterium]
MTDSSELPQQPHPTEPPSVAQQAPAPPVPAQQLPAPQQQPQYARPQQYQPQVQPVVPQAYYAVPQYAVPVVAYAPPQPKGLSVTSMVLGLVSIVFGFTLLAPIGAVVFGAIGLKKEPAGRGMSITGIVLGGLCLLLWAALVVVWIIAIAGILGVAATLPATSNY